MRWKNDRVNLAESHRLWRERNRDRIKEKYRAWRMKPENLDRERELSRKNAEISPSTQRFFLAMKLGEAVNKQQNQTMKNEMTKQNDNNMVQQFLEAFREFANKGRQVCKMLVRMVEADAEIYDKIIAAEPLFNYNKLESMRKAGTGEYYYDLIFDDSVAARRLLALPPAQQKKLYTSPVKIVKVVGEKKIVEEKLFTKMSRAEQNQVVDPDTNHVRTVEEQIAYVKPPAPSRLGQRHHIADDGSGIEFLAKSFYTVSQLEEILSQAKQKALRSLPGAVKSNQLKPK